MNEGTGVENAVNRLWKVRGLGVGVKIMVYERIVVPSVLYGADSWGLQENDKTRWNVMEMKYLGSMG